MISVNLIKLVTEFATKITISKQNKTGKDYENMLKRLKKNSKIKFQKNTDWN